MAIGLGLVYCIRFYEGLRTIERRRVGGVVRFVTNGWDFGGCLVLLWF